MLRLPRQIVRVTASVNDARQWVRLPMWMIYRLVQMKTLTAIEDTSLVVTLADFGYADEDTDPITGVKITTLESAGDLKLDDNGCYLKCQVINKADIEAGKLTFQGAANADRWF